MRNHAAREIHPLRYWYTIIGMHWFLLARHWLPFLPLPRQGGSLPLFTTLSSQATLPLTHALEMKEAVQAARAKEQTSVDPLLRAELLSRYQRAIAAGYQAHPAPSAPAIPKRGKPKQSPARNLLDRLCTHQEAVLRFFNDFDVPFDNNVAERDIR